MILASQHCPWDTPGYKTVYPRVRRNQTSPCSRRSPRIVLLVSRGHLPSPTTTSCLDLVFPWKAFAANLGRRTHPDFRLGPAWPMFF